MQSQLIKISKIKNNSGQIEGLPKNPRLVIDEKFEKLVKSIQEDPEMLELRELIVYPFNDEFIVIAGNMRLKAMKQLNHKECVCKVLPIETTPEKLKAYTIKDNLSYGAMDWDVISTDWEEDKEQLEEWGLDLPSFESEDVQIPAKEDNYEAPENIQVDVVLGDLIEIGVHRLLCGDSTDSDAVAKVMGNEKIDLVFADPPYGIKIVNSGSKKVGGGETKFKGKVGGNNFVDAKVYSEVIGDDSTDTARDFYNTCVSLGMENFIIWGGNYFTDFLPPSMCWIVWDKENTGNFADVELAWTSFNKAAKLYKWLWNGMSRKGERSIEGKTRVHPTQKPVGLFCDIFKDFDFNICFDGFLGSGSTMVASHQLNRKCYGLELDPKYCQVIINRMVKLDPNLEVKINGIPYEPKPEKVPF